MVVDDSLASTNRPLAVVTGASSGIGYELAKQFAQHGFDLLVTGRSEKIVKAAESLRDLKSKVDYFRADLAQYEDIEALYSWIESKGPIEAIALNAGIGIGGDFMRGQTLEENLHLVALNVTAVVHLAKRVGEDMVLRKRGKILITSSTSAMIPLPYLATYSASKAFEHSFALSLGSELEGTGVTVTSLMPGPTETNWFEGANIDETKLGRMKRDDPARVARQGYRALMKGRRYVVAGSLINKVQVALAKTFPAFLVTPVTRFLVGRIESVSGR
jgi:short-subunit dehydrogenase